MTNTASPAADRIGVLDLGSNTVLLLVLERGGRVVEERSTITRLGQDVFESGRLAPDAVERTRSCALELAARARALGATRVVAVGTEALRRAADGEEFLARLALDADLDAVRLLSGDEEAGYAIEASRRALGSDDPLVVIDVGGGSTEVAWTTHDGEVDARSLPLGSVRLTGACLPDHPIPAADLERARERIAAETAGLPDVPALAAAAGTWPVAVAGTATTLAALDLRLVEYRDERVEGYRVDRGALARWIEVLARLDVSQRRSLPGMEAGRADVIVAGLLILEGLGQCLDVGGFRVSGRGVRHGVALRLLAEDPPF